MTNATTTTPARFSTREILHPSGTVYVLVDHQYPHIGRIGFRSDADAAGAIGFARSIVFAGGAHDDTTTEAMHDAIATRLGFGGFRLIPAL